MLAGQIVYVLSIEPKGELVGLLESFVAIDDYLHITKNSDWLSKIFGFGFAIVIFLPYSRLQGLIEVEIVCCQLFLNGVVINELEVIVSRLSKDLHYRDEMLILREDGEGLKNLCRGEAK